MDGILVIDKPEGWTSHDVVARVRRILKTKRVGHTGTLDPFATGVLVLLVGRATRLAQFLDKDEKEYEAVIQFGFETDTGDKTGKPKAAGSRSHPVDPADLEKVLPEFIGEIEQVPPMYSAKKQGGRKLYEIARQGKDVERKPVKITISRLELIGPGEVTGDHNSRIRIRVVCSAGTYVRTLAEDIGRRLGLGAHLTELRRTRAGRFGLGTSVTLDQLDQSIDPTSILLPIEKAVSHLPKYFLSNDRVEKTRNGLSTHVELIETQMGQHVQMVDHANRLIAIGFLDIDEATIKPKIVLT
jgi:tRNA pseudouridine55 synthase